MKKLSSILPPVYSRIITVIAVMVFLSPSVLLAQPPIQSRQKSSPVRDEFGRLWQDGKVVPATGPGSLGSGHRSGHNPQGGIYFPSPIGTIPPVRPTIRTAPGPLPTPPPPIKPQSHPWSWPAGGLSPAGPNPVRNRPVGPRTSPGIRVEPSPRWTQPSVIDAPFQPLSPVTRNPLPNPPAIARALPQPVPQRVPEKNVLPAPQPKVRPNPEPFSTVRMASTAEVDDAQREVDELIASVSGGLDQLLVKSVDEFLREHANGNRIAAEDIDAYVDAYKTGDHVALKAISERNGVRFENDDKYFEAAQRGKNLAAFETQIDEFHQAIANGTSPDELRRLRDQLTETWAHLDVTGQSNPFFWPVVAEGDVEGLFQSTIEQLALLLDAKERLAAAEADDPGGDDPGGDDPGGVDPGGVGPGGVGPGGVGPGGVGPGGVGPGGIGPGGVGPIGSGSGIWIFLPTLPPGAVCWAGPGVVLYGSGNDCNCSCVVYGTPAVVGLPIPTIEPLPDAQGEGQWTEDRIVLLNPADSGGDVNFVLSDESALLTAGETHEIAVSAAVIRFNRGGDFGDAKYRLVPGSYKFAVTVNGWELYRTTFEATLDNTANSGEFRLLLGNESIVVPAGEDYPLKSDHPIRVAFHTGVADKSVTKELADNGTYTIGINTETGGWDLFLGDASASGVGKADDALSVASTDGHDALDGDDSLTPQPDPESPLPLPETGGSSATDGDGADAIPPASVGNGSA